MKSAVIFSVPMPMTNRFAWRWRSADHAEGSEDSFGFYADCVADAKRNGYTAELGRIESRSDPASGFSEKRA
jgi:hypothetical protein